MTSRRVAGCRFDSGFDFTVTYPAVWGPHSGKVVDLNAEWRVERCTPNDFLAILTDLEDFWGDAADRARRVHHPIFVHEFGDTAWIVRDEGRIIAYLLGFWSQTEPTGYIHLVAVRKSHQGESIGPLLYERFEAVARQHGCTKLKAITPPINTGSIAFHRHLGFRLLGEPNEEGVPVVTDYFGPGIPRVVFEKKLA
jgi:GNAT superfamily N-acetyltransferase